MAAGAGRSGVIDEFDFYEATFELGRLESVKGAYRVRKNTSSIDDTPKPALPEPP